MTATKICRKTSWYAFEQEAKKRALLEWAEEEGLKVDD